MRIAILVCALVAVAHAEPKKRVPGALVLVLDRSGSMQGPKLDSAKAAALAAVDALDPADQVAVVTFDSEAQLAVSLQPAANRAQIAKALSHVVAGGGTSFLPALEAVKDVLAGSKLKHRHVVFMSDGESPDDKVAELTTAMHKSGITFSAVGLQGADRNLLTVISDAGGGRLYMVEDAKSLADIFRKEIDAFVR